MDQSGPIENENKPSAVSTVDAPESSARRRRGLLPNALSIAHKLAIVITLLITTGMILLGVLIINNQTHLLQKQIAEFGNAVSQQLGESSKELVLSDDVLGLMVLISNLDTSENILGAVVYSDSGKVLAASGTVPPANVLVRYNDQVQRGESSNTVEWANTDPDEKPQNVVSFIKPIHFEELIAGYALVSFSKQALTQSVHETFRAIAATTVLMIIIGIIVSYIMGRKLTRPLHKLMDASLALSQGDFKFRISERRDDEIGFLIEAFNNMADSMVEKHQVESVFSRFVSPNVAKQILKNLEHVKLGGKHVHATALFADIVGFTSLSEKLSPDEVAELLNEYFTYISMATRYYHGTVDKYMGDCAMVIFGAPEQDPNHQFNAIGCAVMIQNMVDRLNAKRASIGKYPIYFRIGVNSGPMLAGNMGSQDRMQYTVVGDAVNLAARLHTVAEKGQIVISEPLYTAPTVYHRVNAKRHGSINLRGKTDPVTTYLVRDVVKEEREKLEGYLDELLASRIVA